MTLYILYDYFPPAFRAGGPIQSLANLAHYLRGHLPTRVVCNDFDLGRKKLKVIPDTWTPYNDIQVYYSSNGFFSYWRKLDKRNGILFINGIYSIHYNLLPLVFFRRRKIVSVRGMLHPGALQQKWFKKKLYLSAWKILGLHRRCEYHATSEFEKRQIAKQFGEKTKIWVIPNLHKQLTYKEPPSKKNGELVMATIALISPMKNHAQVLKALMGCTSKIIYRIYGPVKDQQYWKTCKELMQRLPANIIVEYHGEIEPGLIESVLKDIHVYIQPSKSENFGHSIIEALCIGRPVITSMDTPWNELKENGAGLNISADSVEEISKGIEFYAGANETEFCEWSRKAMKYAATAVSVDSVGNQYLDMFAHISN